MSIDMYLGRARSQASSVHNLNQSMNQNYNSLETAVFQFINEEELKGKAYTSAKQFFSAVVIPLMTSMKTLNDLMEQASNTFVERYTNEVDTQTLKESELEEDINELKQRISRFEDLNIVLKKHLSDNRSAIEGNQQIISSLQQQKYELEEKLRKLRAFNQVSPEIFKEVESFHQIIQQGIAQLQNGWDPVKQVFNIPSGKDLEWAEASYEKFLSVEMQKIKEKAKNAKLDKQDGQIIKEYAEKHPDETMQSWLKNYIINNKESILRDLGLDITSTLLEQLGLHSVRLGAFINTAGGLKGPEGPNSFRTIERSWGNIFINHSGTWGKIGKYGSKSITGLGFGIGMYDDLSDGRTVGEALSHNTFTLAAGAGGMALAGIFLGSNPVGWAVLGSFAVATLFSFGANLAYESNLFGTKDKVDWIGHKIDDGIDAIKTSANDAVERAKDVGDVVKNIGDHINPMEWAW
ncbi:T7SS effector LXG polymorphic toxin [Staphylococcus ratti]|uniref:LXG domain-containing protein n=1 Tax=Staphylococcus ratti TaxID=2892440 RepID=A0ABY3PEY7_9STAP|nr:T7SS effector LXG polymorphic toxin [Staphylococcus ratti]UEX90902.1 LXG domain-containing protein [Staphylococcus ratti]